MSFTAAAQELNVTQSAISHEVKALETYYGTALFRRAKSGLVLTREGKRLFGVAGEAFAELARLGAGLTDPETSGTVSLAAPPLFFASWLMPHINAFTERHPAVNFRLINATEDRPELVREVDLVVLFANEVPEGMDGVKLLSIRQSPVASPALVATRRPAKTAESLGEYRILHEFDTTPWEMWCGAAGIEGFQPSNQWLFDDPALMIEASIRGYGIGMGAFPLNDNLIAEGKLVRLFKEDFAAGKAYHLVRPEDASRTTAAGIFFAWLRDTLALGA